jgi:hypothetical protein
MLDEVEGLISSQDHESYFVVSVKLLVGPLLPETSKDSRRTKK